MRKLNICERNVELDEYTSPKFLDWRIWIDLEINGCMMIDFNMDRIILGIYGSK